MEITPQSEAGAIAARYPRTMAVFERHGIDFCCRGRRSLAEVCREQGLEYEALRAELEGAASQAPSPQTSWAEAPLPGLMDHIVGHFHAKLRRDLPALSRMAAKVQEAHGERYPEMLSALASTFAGLRQELEAHMGKEEEILFPFLRELAEAGPGGAALPGPAGAVIAGPIAVMEEEHEGAARALARLRELTGGYQAPADACDTFRGLLAGLAELEGDLHEHIHLENNILFPRAAELAAEVEAGGPR